MSTSPTHPSTGFDFNYFLAELERSDGAEIVALFKAAMTMASLSFDKPGNITEETTSKLLAQARAKHAARSS